MTLHICVAFYNLQKKSSIYCFLTLKMTLAGKYSFFHFVKKETEAGNVIIQQIFLSIYNEKAL